MRICVLLEEVYPPDVRVRKEVRALVEDGHEVYVLSHAAADRPERETVGGAEVIRRPIRETHRGVGGWASGLRYLLTYVHRGWLRETAEIIESEDIDVLHAHDLPVVKTAIELGERYDLPVIADLHENWPEAKRYYRKGTLWNNALSNPRLVLARLLKSNWRLKQFERESVRRADRVIAVVEEGKDHYVRDCGAAPEMVAVVSNVVDLDSFDGAGITPLGYDDEFVISYVGTLSGEHRGLGTVVEAMPGILERVENARLLIVGPMSGYARRLEERSYDLGVADRVTFTDRMPFEEVPSYMAASDVCLVPHRKNPHTETTVPHKLFQYMAAERPVVVTDVTPVARIVRETDAGRVVPPDAPDAMAESIVELARHPETRRELGRNGRTAVEDRYNWTVEGEKLRELYRSVESASSQPDSVERSVSTE